ncbi:MAG: hypothetical protein WD751_06875 [Anaerolineales bacterium]
MKQSSTRLLIILLTLYTGIVHLVALNLGGLQPLFILNGLGYFALLGALLLGIPAGQERLVHYAFMAYTAVTIGAWVVMNGDFTSILGVSTKAVELLLILVLWLDMKRTPA